MSARSLSTPQCALVDRRKWPPVSLAVNSTKWTAVGGNRVRIMCRVIWSPGQASPTISTIAARLADEHRLYHTSRALIVTAPGSRPSGEYNHLSSPPYRQQYGQPRSSLATAPQEAVPAKLDYCRRLGRRQKCPSACVYTRIKRNSSTSRCLFHVRRNLKLTLLTLTEYMRVCAWSIWLS